MRCRRLLMLGLDGYEPSIGERLMAQGRLPALQRLKARSACVDLDHGDARRTGLAWEHVASGLSPDDARRWAAVDFDAASYRVWQEPTSQTPFPARLSARTVVFDPPYFDLARGPALRGAVAWGAHDPGVAPSSNPPTLNEEIERRFGRYPAREYIYGFVWPSPDRAQAMATALRRATALRGEIAQWLLAERLPDWDLGIVVVSEFHSALEALWHGIDPSHPLHGLPSAGPAREGIEGVYEESDRLLARLEAALPDAQIVVFNLHGMGPNNADLASMVLLPELLYRQAFGRPLLQDAAWAAGPGGLPMLPDGLPWQAAMASAYGDTTPAEDRPGLAARALRKLGRLAGAPAPPPSARLPLGWMPATRYQPHWPRMPAFALPSFYDGRVRINLAGREAQGSVEPGTYAAALDTIEALLHDCRDAITGEPVVDAIVRAAGPEPSALPATGSDLVIAWRGAPLGFVHPRLGRIGPLPYRRTGGHTGGHGMAWWRVEGLAAGAHGVADAFDVVPTVIDLLGEDPPVPCSGHSLLPRLRVTARAA